MKILTVFFAVLLGTGGLLSAAPAQAEQTVAGYVTRLRGDVQSAVDTQRQPVALGHALLLGAKLVTGPDARMDARMKDGTVLTLGERTEFIITHVAEGVTKSVKGSQFELLKGAFRAITAPADPQKTALPLQVRTPVAVIGVRGTDFWGGFNLLASGDSTLDVVMLEGKGVFVENGLGMVDLVKGGDGTTVNGASATPAPLKPWGAKKLQAAMETVTW
jgi:hypothetical protein